METPWHHLFYFVAQRRNDGTAPTLEKAVEQRFFLTYEEAKPIFDHVQQSVGDYYGIFVANAEIPTVKPVTNELTTDQYRSIFHGQEPIVILPFQVGDKVRLRKEVDRAHDFIAPAGLTGTITQISDTDLFAKMDQTIDGAEEWDNHIIWPIGSDEERTWTIEDLEKIG